MNETAAHPATAPINGATELYAIIGDPIAQAKTPALINPLIAATGRNAVLVPLHVPAADFDTVAPALMKMPNLKGLVITYPFKDRALRLVQEASRRARAVGGINAMRRNPDGSWSGDIFDGVGLLNAVAGTCRVNGARVLLIGAGGAGRAIGVAFAEAAAAEIMVYDVDPAKAQNLVASITKAFPACRASLGGPAAGGCDILINATPVGMAVGDGLPAEVGALSAGMTVIDIVPVTAPTPLMKQAAAAGATVIAGKAMTEGQASALLEFFGIDAGA